MSDTVKYLSGVYSIRNTVNNKVYIGSAICFLDRFCQHSFDLRNGKHNRRFQNFVNKHGIDCLFMECLEVCDKDKLIEREQYWINYFEAFKSKKGFNICRIAGSTLGCKMPESHKSACRERMKKQKYMLGKKLSEKTKQKLSEISKQRWEDNRDKMSEAVKKAALVKKGKQIWNNKKHPMLGKEHPMKGKKRSKDFCRKQSEAKLKNNPMKGRKLTDEQKEIRALKFSKPVLQIDKNGMIIQEFRSATMAEKELGLNASSVSRVCNGEYKNTKNMIFRWK